jgi:hypothetical protein
MANYSLDTWALACVLLEVGVGRPIFLNPALQRHSDLNIVQEIVRYLGPVPTNCVKQYQWFLPDFGKLGSAGPLPQGSICKVVHAAIKKILKYDPANPLHVMRMFRAYMF